MEEIRIEGGSCELAVGESRNVVTIFAPAWRAEPLSIVLQRFDVDPVSPADASADRGLTGRLLIGATRVSDSAEFDVENGTVLTVPCGRAEVQVSYEPDPQPGATYPRQRVIAFAYGGTRPGGVRPTRRVRFGALGIGARVDAPIPKYASAVRVFCYPNIYPSITARCLRAPAGRELAEWTVTGPTLDVRIPAGSERLQIAVAAAAVVTAEFELCL